MPLIKSISGIRGTIGGASNDNLTPIDIVTFASAYGTWLQHTSDKEKLRVVIGRDARISGVMVQQLIAFTLVGMGIDVICLGLSTTPTVEMAVPLEAADGGIIVTASHNPRQWNALKLLNAKGEFLNALEGKAILESAESGDFNYASVDNLGKITEKEGYIDIHIDHILNLPLVAVEKNTRCRV